MNGTSATTGKRLAGVEHLRQSVRDILTTPVGSRVMRRTYGSRLFDLIDAPANSQTLLDIYAATADALRLWEPRIQLQRVKAESAEPGRVVLTLSGLYMPDGVPVTLDGIVVS